MYDGVTTIFSLFTLLIHSSALTELYSCNNVIKRMSVVAVIQPKRLSLLAGESFNMNNER